jgi:hypothetical protein
VQQALVEDNTTDFKLDSLGLIRFKGMVYLLERIRKQFVKELHKALTSRHLGIEKTRNKVAKYYYFLLITKIVEQVLKECEVCQKTKAVHRALYRLLMLPNTPKEPWALIAIDFIVKLLLLRKPLTRAIFDAI